MYINDKSHVIKAVWYSVHDAGSILMHSCVRTLEKVLVSMCGWVNEACSINCFECSLRVEKCCISSGPFTWLIYSKSSKEIWGSALQIWYQWELLHRSSKQKSKQKPCSLPKCLLHAFCWWQTSTCKTAEANGISPCGPTYCTHSSCMKVFFFFWWNALTFLLN